MRGIEILSRQECVRRYGRRHRPNDLSPVAIVSISSTGHNVPQFDGRLACRVIRLKFDDVLGWSHYKDAVPMSRGQAAEIVSFVRDVEDMPDPLPMIVHCDGGVSRSAGVAAALLDLFGDLGVDGRAVWLDGRFVPNEWCYARVMEAGGSPVTEGRLKALVMDNVSAVNHRYDWEE